MVPKKEKKLFRKCKNGMEYGINTITTTCVTFFLLLNDLFLASAIITAAQRTFNHLKSHFLKLNLFTFVKLEVKPPYNL